MVGALAVLALAIGCVGFGAVMLRGLGLMRRLDSPEHALWAFVLGLGGLGWVGFFLGIAGVFTPAAFLLLTVLGMGGAFMFRPSRVAWVSGGASAGGMTPAAAATALMVAALTAVFLYDLAEALSPPADADTLSYHFALPKMFLENGAVAFVPRAVDGAVPLLLQMTYSAAFALGGELATSLWAMLTGWIGVALVFVIARPHLSRNGALALALVIATTPAVIYGAGTGQVEMRNALFVMVGVAALAEAVRTSDHRFIIIAAAAAGFFAGAKYTGLLFVAALGLTMLIWRRDLGWMVLFGMVAAVAGGQWYVWNWLHTGDPVFPLLYDVLAYKVPEFWDRAHHEAFKQSFFGVEKAVPVNLWEFLVYPFRASLNPPDAFEALRIGFGPLGLLIMPFALAGAWMFRRSLTTSRLSVFALAAFLFYGLWFFTASSQRVRHLLPVYPLVAVCLGVAAWKWAGKARAFAPLAAAFLLTICVQFGAHSIFSIKFFGLLAGTSTRDQFIERNVPLSSSIRWINANLDDGNRIFLDVRYLSYLTDVPYFYAHVFHQAQIDILPTTDDPRRFLKQLRAQKIDHVLISNWSPGPFQAPYRGKLGLAHALLAKDCAQIVHRFVSDRFMSRTLPSLHSIQQPGVVLRLSDTPCRLEEPQ